MHGDSSSFASSCAVVFGTSHVIPAIGVDTGIVFPDILDTHASLVLEGIAVAKSNPQTIEERRCASRVSCFGRSLHRRPAFPSAQSVYFRILELPKD